MYNDFVSDDYDRTFEIPVYLCDEVWLQPNNTFVSMNLLKHAQRHLKQCEKSAPTIESGSYDHFSGSIALLNDHIKATCGPWINYHAYIKSSAWLIRKDYYRDYYGGVCQRCRKKKCLGMSLHHITYARKGWEALDDLEYICRECHFGEHNKQHLRDLGLEV